MVLSDEELKEVVKKKEFMLEFHLNIRLKLYMH